MIPLLDIAQSELHERLMVALSLLPIAVIIVIIIALIGAERPEPPKVQKPYVVTK